MRIALVPYVNKSRRRPLLDPLFPQTASMREAEQGDKVKGLPNDA
jgi:hypothetical protein